MRKKEKESLNSVEKADSKITLEFTQQQQQQIIKKCGFNPKPIVTNVRSLAMLSLLAEASKSQALFVGSRLSLAKTTFSDESGHLLSDQPYTITLDLTPEQRKLIRKAIHKDWFQIMLFPDGFEVNFTEKWELNTSVQHIGHSFVVLPDDIDYSPNLSELMIRLPVGDDKTKDTFGKGKHPTTQICLYLLEKFLNPGMIVLDVGTGSGVLAVGAMRLGAKNVTAVDVNPDAVYTAQKAAELNGFNDSIHIKKGSLECVEGTYDLVVANLFPEIILTLAPQLNDRIKPKGNLLVSGIVTERVRPIRSVLESVGFIYLGKTDLDIWSGMAFVRN